MRSLRGLLDEALFVEQVGDGDVFCVHEVLDDAAHPAIWPCEFKKRLQKEVTLRRISAGPQICARDSCRGLSDSVDAIRRPDASSTEVRLRVIGCTDHPLRFNLSNGVISKEVVMILRQW